jgi:diguanylate cyclase (GGDEF)-like protein
MDQPSHNRDGLTGLATREALGERASGFASRADGEVWSVILVDVDHFKLINDVFGHLQGDRVLQRIADIISRNTRSTDSVIRYGGDEFLVVMSRTGNLQAANQAQRILEDLSLETFPKDMQVSLSLGVADSRPGDRDLSTLIERADKALYQAKDGGRGRISFYQDETDWSSQATITFDHFVDRQHELKSLRQALDEVLSDGGRFALISGEPGIGKSRLVAELTHYCSFRGCHFLETKCDEMGSSRPYEMLLQPMLRYLLDLPEERRKTVLDEIGSVCRHTGELLPELDLQVSREAEEALPDPEGSIRHRIFSEASSILRKIAEDQPVVYLVDGLQWMSGHDLEMFCYMVRTSGTARILFTATVRTPLEDHPEVHEQMEILSRLVPFLSVELDELPDEYAGHMIMFALRDPHIPKEILRKLVSQSGGNPFYLRELLKALREKGSIEPSSTGGWEYRIEEEVDLPDSVSQLISSRLDTLDDDSREILRTAALAPGTFTISLLSSVMGISDLDTARAFREPLRMEIITERLDVDFSPLYSFNHDIVRSFLCRDMSHGIRKALHSKFARFYEEQYSSGDSSLLMRVAHYYMDSLDRKSAQIYSLKAARESLRGQSSREALRWLESYVSLSGVSISDDEENFFVWSELGRLYTVVADHGKALDALGKAKKLARTDEQQGLISADLGQLYYNMGDYGEAVEELENSIALLPCCEKSIRSKMRLAFISHLQGDSGKANRIFDESYELIQSIVDSQTRKRLEAAYSSGAGFIKVHSRSAYEGIELCRRAVTLHRELDDRAGEARAILNLAAVLSSGGNWEERIRILDRAQEVLTETGDTHSIMVALVNLGQVYFALRQFEQSREYFEKCLALVEATGTRRFEVWCRCHIAMILEQEERFEHSREWYDRAIANAEELGLARMLVVSRLNLTTMLLKLGEFEDAQSLMELIASDETLPQMGENMQTAFMVTKALELYLNRSPDRDRKESLAQAEKLFREAREGASDRDMMNFAESSCYLARCVEESGRSEESLEIAASSLETINQILRSVRNSVYRDDMYRMKQIQELIDIKDRLRGD